MFTVRKERIDFIVKGSKVIGHLFIPEDGKVKKYPAVFIGGPMTSVKEQVTGVYAKSLAERGFIAIDIVILVKVRGHDNMKSFLTNF